MPIYTSRFLPILKVMMNRKKSGCLHSYGSWFFFTVAGFLIFSAKDVAATDIKNETVNVGVVLDLKTMFGRESMSILSTALHNFYSSHAGYQTRIKFHVRDSKQDDVAAASSALDLIKYGEVVAIIGPVTSTQAHFMISLGNKAQVPIISFSATNPSLSNPYFLRTTQRDSAQVKGLSSMIKYFSWREAVPVFARDDYGEGIVPYLTDALQEVDCRVPYRSSIAPEATDSEIREELYKLMTMETKVFIVHMKLELGIRMFHIANEIGMLEDGFVWIVTDGIGNMLCTMNSTVLESMKGVLGIRNLIPKSKELENFRIRWKRKFISENTDIHYVELDMFGIWAHDTVVALAMAVEEVSLSSDRSKIFRSESNDSTQNKTDLDTLPVSTGGPRLREALLSISFKGLSGNFFFKNGEVRPNAYQIVNVDENGGRGIGYWTAEGGLSRTLNFNKTGIDSNFGLGQTVWPGGSNLAPKGWTIPVIGKKLRVGCPGKIGFEEFVKVIRDPVTGAVTKVTGYSIDVFEAAILAMPYPVEYEYVPYSNGTAYDDLTYQVYLGAVDAVVGDITIIAKRSSFVDFTLPFTESGVWMVVPIRDDSTNNAWLFLAPLTWKLWFTSFCFFIFIGFVIWVLEHRINEDFRGPPLHQIGTMFWFSFSTMVYAHREKVVSNFARFVVIVWVFVVLILIQTYTASLTSMLTVQKLQPTVTDVNELIRLGKNVGYKEGTFVLDLLKEMKFDQAKLISYKTIDELHEAFHDGKIAAAFDEIPYMRLFLRMHCSKYTTVGRTYKTDGFGFVFPKHSPLVPDVSRAVLNVTQGDKMLEIERKWFGDQPTCPDGDSTSMPSTSRSIGLDSFWGLFLIAGVASVSALIIYAATFLYQHKDAFSSLDDASSWWNKVLVLFRHFDNKDMTSHTFKKSQFCANSSVPTGSPGASPINQGQDEFSFGVHADLGEPPFLDHGDPSSGSPGPPFTEISTNRVDSDDHPIQDSSQPPLAR